MDILKLLSTGNLPSITLLPTPSLGVRSPRPTFLNHMKRPCYLSRYPRAYVIDGWRCQLLPLEREHLNDFTKNPGEEEGLRNLLFLS
jgi:hypothetical protein